MADALDLEASISRTCLSARVVDLLADRLLAFRGHLRPGDHLIVSPEDADTLIHMASEAAAAARAARDTFNSMSADGWLTKPPSHRSDPLAHRLGSGS